MIFSLHRLLASLSFIRPAARPRIEGGRSGSNVAPKRLPAVLTAVAERLRDEAEGELRTTWPSRGRVGVRLGYLFK